MKIRFREKSGRSRSRKRKLRFALIAIRVARAVKVERNCSRNHDCLGVSRYIAVIMRKYMSFCLFTEHNRRNRTVDSRIACMPATRLIPLET